MPRAISRSTCDPAKCAAGAHTYRVTRMTSTALAPSDFADAIEQHYVDASDDARKVEVGLQDQSNAAEIYGRFVTVLAKNK